MNKYYILLQKIISSGEYQDNKKGRIKYLLNEVLSMAPDEMYRIFKEHPIAKGKLASELALYFQGETDIKLYNKVGIKWWDYCAPKLSNSYPTYFKKMPKLIDKINKEKSTSKNYVFFAGETGVESNQQPCISLTQFQIVKGELFISVYQRSADSNLGLPSDIYQMYLISNLIDAPLANITFFIGNAHLYTNNIEKTKRLLRGEKVKFELNV